ncbi:TetR/AcrR family transcriptional regulator [Kribbella capetownensis]|uniref:TetR/AcrR family transcriptional regulator n=1 Tax=Kribbella capetownensis TaxID=1572659 RepID=A0A4R0JUW5_9ACTN|nr:TetR/AcrR family transcriptional regulator [Kribbella capetownensis]TCC50789.1 TetR/AcrR family transcriptional regulator [Kribbella capetownensis]
MCSANIASPRPYRKAKRALTEAETRQRIVEATVELHETLGPAKTTIKAVAERAGVQRATVYNHFPDLQALFEACNAHYYERHPMPDPASWIGIASPNERFRVAVRELYRWYEETEAMLSAGIRDIDAVPPAAREAFFGYFSRVAGSLMTGRRERGRVRLRTAAAIGHAISFVTWRSLVREQSLTSEEAADLMEAMVGTPAG